MLHTIRITFGGSTQPKIEIQQGDYNSRTIQALCYTSSGSLMSFDGQTVSVVYSISGAVSAEYPVQVTGNVLSFTMPGLASASVGAGSMQVRIYGSESLLQSAIIPYVVKASLDPGPADEDQVPMLVMLVQQAQEAIVECNKATENANKTVANIEKKLADGDFIGKTGDTGPQGFQGVGVTGASLNGQGELVFTVKDPATGKSSTLLPVDIDTSAAINTVEQAAQDGVQKVQDAQAGAISAVDQAGKNAGTQAVSEVNSAKDTAISSIGTAQSGAESAITAAQQSAVQTVQQSGTTAVGQVQKAQNTATTAIAQAQQNAIAAVENEGDAQVQRLQEIVPQPTADNNGMVVAVQSGAYQLENPAGLVLNDGVITSKNGWSSMQIVDTLCPAFKETGNPVVCYPVANYPLEVKASWEPRQEGEGDPSPENVRPITGMDEVQVTRCGKNLMPYNKPSPSTYTANGITFTWNDDGSIHIIGTAVGRTSSNIMWFDDFSIPPGKYRMIGPSTLGVSPQFVVKKADTGANDWYNAMNPVTIENGDVPQYFYVSIADGTVVDDTIYAFLSYGSEVPSVEDYAPYTGTAATLTMPETVYGGTLDVGTGVGSEEWSSVINLSSSNNLGILEDYANETTMLYYVGNLDNMQNTALVYCSHLPTTNIINSSNTNIGIFGNPEGDMVYIRLSKETASNLDEFKQWVDAQSAAGTPVQVTYKLATPQPIQATGSQSIPALPGTNTIYTNADSVTVTGRADPIATITALQNRVSALESAHTNI